MSPRSTDKKTNIICSRCEMFICISKQYKVVYDQKKILTHINKITNKMIQKRNDSNKFFSLWAHLMQMDLICLVEMQFPQEAR